MIVDIDGGTADVVYYFPKWSCLCSRYPCSSAPLEEGITLDVGRPWDSLAGRLGRLIGS